MAKPLKATGGLVILKGNLAPEGCVVKVAGHERMIHRGPARVFDREEDAFPAVQAGEIKAGDVVVIRYEGPKGGPGMREMLGVTAALVGAGLGRFGRAVDRRPLLGCDARLDGRPRGAGSRARRADRGGARRRFDRFRHQSAALGCGDFGSRNASRGWASGRRRSRVTRPASWRNMPS